MFWLIFETVSTLQVVHVLSGLKLDDRGTYVCFASSAGVFITHGDVGVGTIVGSAVFNILCIVGVCGLFAGQVSEILVST